MHNTLATPAHHWDGLGASLETLGRILDHIFEALQGPDVHGSMSMLLGILVDLRQQLSPERWWEVVTQLRSHPVHRLLLHSPFTRRGFVRPRGYTGDAELIDLIYGCGPRLREDTTLGEALYSWGFESSGCRSVRYRRALLAREIDRVAAEHVTPSVLSFACGHLREAELSVAVRSGRIRMIAVDQDAESVALVAREHGNFAVTSQVGTVRDVLRRRLPIGNVSLIYAAGLYDYLDTDLATALTSALFRSLGHDGRLLLANFTPETRDAAYMEACMDWRLCYRTESQVVALTARVPEKDIVCIDQFRDPDRNIAYLRLVRR